MRQYSKACGQAGWRRLAWWRQCLRQAGGQGSGVARGKRGKASRPWAQAPGLCAWLVLLALLCRVVIAEAGPRHVIVLPELASASPPALAARQGVLTPLAHGLLLIRYENLAILALSAEGAADAGAHDGQAVSHWPRADLLLVLPAGNGRYQSVAPLARLHGLAVVMAAPAPAPAAALPGPALYPLHTWEALALRKGRSALRVTAMQGEPGNAEVAGFMLELGGNRAAVRLYLTGQVLGAGQRQAISARMPGMDFALIPAGEPASWLLQGAGGAPAALTADGYRFTARKR